MFNFKRKLTKNEKLDFLEYLAFQIKSDMSFEKALVRYNSNQNRKKHVLETCNNTIQDIRNGKTPADALFDNELIERLEYGIVKNGRSNKELYESLTSIININKGNISNSNELQKAVRHGVLLIVFVFLLIPLFKNELTILYGTFEQMQAMTGKKDVVVELPFLIKYWWASFVIIGLIGSLYLFIKFLITLCYKFYTKMYYAIFINVFYQDLISVLKTFYQLQGNMSVSNSYQIMLQSPLNDYWRDLFQSIVTNLKHGGKASEILYAEKNIIPEEVINCFIDAEDTGEFKTYINKALENSIAKNQDISKNIKEFAPLIINLLLFMVVGYLVTQFIKDITENGLLDVMNAI